MCFVLSCLTKKLATNDLPLTGLDTLPEPYAQSHYVDPRTIPEAADLELDDHTVMITFKEPVAERSVLMAKVSESGFTFNSELKPQ